MTIRRAVCAVLAAVGLVTMLVVPVARADDALGVLVDVSSVSSGTLVLGSSGEVQISGTVTNNTGAPLTWVTVEFWRSQSAIATSRQLADALREPPTYPAGSRLRNEAAGNLVYIAKETAFAPGATASFTVKANVADLGFSDEGAYRVGVHVRALADDGVVRTVGADKWLMPVAKGTRARGALVMLTAPPTMIGPERFMDDSLGKQLTGRLDALLTLAERPGTQFALDPALYDEVAALAGEHLVADTAMPPSATAVSVKRRLDALVAKGSGYRLPYANPDLAAAESLGQLPATLSYTGLALDAKHPCAGLELALVGGPRLTQQVASAVKPAVTFSSNVLAAGAGVIGTTPLPDRGLMPSPMGAWQINQTILAEELVASLDGRMLVRVIRSSDDIAAENLSAPWRALARATPGTGEGTWLPSEMPSPDASLWARIAQRTEGISLYRDLTSDSSAILDSMRLVLRAESLDLPTGTGEALLASGPALPRDAIQLRSQPSFVMTGRENQFPMSIVNRSPVPVRVRVSFESSSPQRVRVADTELIAIPAGETTGLNVAVTSTSNGLVPVTATLVTASGSPVGIPTTIEITATEAGRAAWVIMAVSAVLLIGGTLWRVRAVQRERKAAAS